LRPWPAGGGPSGPKKGCLEAIQGSAREIFHMAATRDSGLITTIVLTKDEAQNLGRCLASLSWCADIVVVDSGSTDGTQAAARALGARVFEHLREPPFRIDLQRNWALENTEVVTPWVLFLDADEAVPAGLARELERVCGDPDCRYDGLEISPRYLFWGRWLKRTQGFPNWHARAVRVGPTRFTGGVWEHFAPGSRIGRLSEPYDHHANSKGFSDWLARHDRYSTWDAERIVDFLESGDTSRLGTSRKLGLRRLAARLWPLRPWARFLQMYIARLGFLEGAPAFAFCMLYFFYEWMTVIKIVEVRRRRRGLPL
jgi:glycosyltransferase involved in cell wall biosynthesis